MIEPTQKQIKSALRDADESITSHYRDQTRRSARILAAALRAAEAEKQRLREALEMCVTSMQDSGYPNEHIAVKAARSALPRGGRE